jgi:tetratricopeptide (TPR) repeat protein
MSSQGSSRIDDLRGRLQKDPASIAFAQLAEEYRRVGRFSEAIEISKTGLARHPGYLSARVTLGRSLLELDDLDEAYRQLTGVLKQAPENLAAIRGLAEVHRRRGELPEALEQFKNAFELAGNDPAIDQMVRDLRREAGQQAPVVAASRTQAMAGGRSDQTTVTPDTPGVNQAAARRVVGYLNRWLEAIMAERRGRIYHAQV